jgi:hypothetical protein
MTVRMFYYRAYTTIDFSNSDILDRLNSLPNNTPDPIQSRDNIRTSPKALTFTALEQHKVIRSAIS